jgi:hypothetical protein
VILLLSEGYRSSALPVVLSFNGRGAILPSSFFFLTNLTLPFSYLRLALMGDLLGVMGVKDSTEEAIITSSNEVIRDASVQGGE